MFFPVYIVIQRGFAWSVQVCVPVLHKGAVLEILQEIELLCVSFSSWSVDKGVLHEEKTTIFSNFSQCLCL